MLKWDGQWVFAGVLLAAIGGGWALHLWVDAQCMRAGWRDGKVAWMALDAYCVKRVDQTDVVVPLREARRMKAAAKTLTD